MSLEYWDKLKQPPEWALGKIGGGKLSGKTDINPQWRIQAMTELFGPVGIGWKFVETARQVIDGATGEKMVFVDIDLFVSIGGKWSAAIPGRGGDMLVETEKGKLVSNDEAVKMATTDALGNAMKYLGVAATVYSKGIDGTKYGRKAAENPPPQPTTPPNPNNPTPANPVPKNPCSESQQRKIETLWQELGKTETALKAELKKCFSVESVSLLEMPQAVSIIKSLEELVVKKKAKDANPA